MQSRIRDVFIMVMSVFILLIAVSSCQKQTVNEDLHQWIKSPAAGDVLLFHSDETPPTYYYIKIVEIDSSILSYYQSPWFYKKQPQKMKLNDGFIPRSYELSITSYQSLVSRGYVLDLKRDYKEKSRYNHLFSEEEWK